MPQGQATDRRDLRDTAGLYLLFTPDMRARREDVLAAVEDIPLAFVSHDPKNGDVASRRQPAVDDGERSEWLELMLSGMTFDLLGLAPGPAVERPDIAHRIGCDASVDPASFEAIALVPGPHLADGAGSLPIVRAMLDLACALARRLEGATTICWSPSRTAMALPMFCKSVESWLSGGPFPALCLVGFAETEEGGLASEGLTFFIGQEVAIDPDVAQDRVAATRLGARLVHDIVGVGRVETPRPFVTAEGARLLLSAEADAAQIKVTRM